MPPRALGFALLLLAGAVAPAPAQQPISGKARALDATTLEVGAQVVRLFGLAAPLAPAHCAGSGGRTWPCGWEAHMALANLTAYQWLRCTPVAIAPDGLPLVTCELGGRGGPDLGVRLVGEGWAAATPDAPAGYREAMAEAQTARRGLWRDGPQAWPQIR